MSENNSRVKEVEVYIHKDSLGRDYFDVFVNPKVSKIEFIKCKLLIPQEERKIELSESTLKKLYEDFLEDKYSQHFYFYLRQKLLCEEK